MDDDDKGVTARSSTILWTLVGYQHSSVIDFSDDAISISPGSRRGFYLATSDPGSRDDEESPPPNIFVLGIGSFERSDRNGLMLSGGLVVFDKFGLSIPGYHFFIGVGYSYSSLPQGGDAVYQNSPSTAGPFCAAVG